MGEKVAEFYEVTIDDEIEHGGTCVHSILGRPMQAVIGGGGAVISSNVKVFAGRRASRSDLSAFS